MSLKKLIGLSLTTALVLPFSSFSQEKSTETKQVNSIVIGQKKNSTDAQKAVTSAAPEVKPVYPGSVKVVDTRDTVTFYIIPADDDVIAQRFKTLENIMPMPYNDHVKKYVDYFLYKRPNFVKQMLERKEFYFPVFEKYLVKHNIPDEMKYLSLLESGLNPNAISHAKAVGLWQFMSYTGKEYGLRITDYMDERRHIEKATDASFRYLTNLYKQFDDWELALAAYNTGPGRIRRAIRKSGKSDYWALHNYIHPDTRAYVPQWEALNYLMNYSAEHGIFPDNTKVIYPMETENLLVDGPLNLESFARLSYMELETLKLLNPHLTSDELPNYAKNVEIRVPVDNYAYFEDNRKCILDSACILLSPSDVIVAQEDAKGSYHIEYRDVKKYYTVRSGDYLGRIADNHNVYISDIKRWNNLRSSTIMKGQRLVIHKKEAVKIYDELNTEPKTAAQPAAVLAKNSDENRSNVKVNQTTASSNQEAKVVAAAQTRTAKTVTKQVKRYHTVRNGDNLTHIARAYHTTISEMMRWNNLKSSKIMKGQRLMYYTTVTEKVFEDETPAKQNYKQYVVQKGDTLWNISQRFGYSVDELKKMNGLTDSDVKVGQKLKI